MKTIYFLFFTCFFMVFFLMIMKIQHMLSFLISLELMVFFLIMLMLSSGFFSIFFFIPVIFLSFSVCESILGLVLMITMIRIYSKDYMQSLNIMKL